MAFDFKEPKMRKNRLSKLQKRLLTAAGILSLFLGLLGIILPLLPTTPFLLLSAACFLRGSNRLHRWLMHHPALGEYIRNFQEYKAIPLQTKIIAIALLWVTIAFTAFFVVKAVWLRILLIGIAVGVSAHILHFKTLPKKD